jgi:prepilin-type N-terminal cleavage/methylation domain-containing protein
MQKIIQIPTKKQGFTLIELLVVVAIIAVLISLLVPALGKAFATAKSTEDKTKIKGIYGAMVLDGSGNEGRLPRPSVMAAQYDPDALNHDNPTTDTTGNLMSLMIARNYFMPETLISPVETNPNIRDMNENDAVYDFDSIDGESILWDEAFEGDIANATSANPAHNSYAHQALCGERIRLKWHTGATASDVILSNRGPLSDLDNSIFDTTSNTLKFHGDDTTWSGNIVCGDGSTRLADNRLPKGIAYQPLNGGQLDLDNIFVHDWNDVQLMGSPQPMASGDNWLVICTTVENENSITTVWD